MEAGLVEEALALLRRAAQGVAAAVLACSPPHSPGHIKEVRSSGRAARRGRGRAKAEGSGPAKSGESRVARVPWREVQAEPRAAGQCTSTGGQKKRTLTADAPDGGSGGTGVATPRWEQRPGPSRRGEFVRSAGLEPQQGGIKQTTRIAGIQGGDSWRDETCVLDFDEDSVEKGELIEEREEEDWWAQGGAGPANVLSKSFQRPRQVLSAVKKVLDGSQIGRRKAEERPPSLTAGEDSAGVRRVSVAVEATEDLGKGAAWLVKGVYVSDMGRCLRRSLRAAYKAITASADGSPFPFRPYQFVALPLLTVFCLRSARISMAAGDRGPSCAAPRQR
ncbi:hypothetical protein NDU88_002871 [Pleurodeles waltl]|uniref:Uncharacterized protein n=1 Tax=Pleurodeles waltl TaxID=8319 RepID=A0AAV7M3Q1_PLEWA|nr:hypothetical protein NDU88_002871 [Pleurodeles waltl]